MKSRRNANRRMAQREHGHMEQGYTPTSSPAKSYGSPGSTGAHYGSGPVPGAGEMPHRGPGAAASRYARRDPGETPMAPAPSGKPPAGMKIYREE